MTAWTDAKENAIFTWVSTSASADVAPERILWAYQRANRPNSPSIELRLIEISRGAGGDFVDYEDHPTPSPGAELLERTRGDRVLRLRITVYGANPTGVNSPHSILERIMTSVASFAVREALREAGIGIGPWDPVTFLPEVINKITFEPRAFSTITLFTTGEVQATRMNIVSADVQGSTSL